MIPEKKVCKGCNEEKELTEFYKQKGGKYGRMGRCIECKVVYSKKYYQENKEKVRAATKKYHQENLEELKEKGKKYYQEHREKMSARNRKWRQDNPEKAKAHYKKYREENPEKRMLQKHRRRVRKLENGIEHFTAKQLKEHWIQKGIDPESCYYCDEGKFEHLDHYVALAIGGPHFMSKLRPACECCNLSKYDKDPEEWMASRL